GLHGGSAVKNPPAVRKLQEKQVQSLGQEDPLEEDIGTHSTRSMAVKAQALTTEPPHPQGIPSDFISFYLFFHFIIFFFHFKVSDSLAQSVIQHLRWIMQKDLLGQDVFLIGPPGPLRRSIAMQYLELTKREVEYIALSRDTTETDLKQRREIRAGTAFYIDQCAVRAATEGRTLILEGLEKAERNVLPVLNNLLENREMQLEDGRFLMSAERYDKLLQDHTKTELDAWKIVRVSENFRVIALGLPVPRYSGNPLDPPLRSRFQARDIYYLPFKDQLKLLYSVGANVPTEKVSQLLSFATTLCSQESSSLGLPDFPLDSLPAAVQILDSFPMMSIQHALQRLYPYTVLLGHEGKMAVEGVLKRFELEDSRRSVLPEEIVRVERTTENNVFQASVTIRIAEKEVTIKVPAGTRPLSQPCTSDRFIQTLSHKQLLAEMMQSHKVKDICLIGGKDMTARDLLQQRYTLPNGDTAWRSSPLVNAALEGKLVLLDGIHRVNAGTLAVLQRLIHDRELSLYDGSRLLREDRYMRLKEELQMSDEQLQQRSIFPVHPSFRIIALAEPPVIGSTTQQWLGPEFLTMFFFHYMKPLVKSEEIQVIKEMVPNMPPEALDKLLSFTHKLRETQDPTAQSLAASLSTRQLLRISRRLSQYPNENLHNAVTKACLSRFLPSLARSALEKNLADAAIEISTDNSPESDLEDYKCEVSSGSLRIGAVSAPIYNAHEKMKVPDVLFYDNIQNEVLKHFLLFHCKTNFHLYMVLPLRHRNKCVPRKLSVACVTIVPSVTLHLGSSVFDKTLCSNFVSLAHCIVPGTYIFLLYLSLRNILLAVLLKALRNISAFANFVFILYHYLFQKKFGLSFCFLTYKNNMYSLFSASNLIFFLNKNGPIEHFLFF
ncbi:hypothetical protein FD754_018427, partial [Muntiacus muntjak]